ncbi:shikimate dehydrogenase [Agromyces protaetiae]|uniref:Shikimate dehydrogenase n=1 Tax=Agromyces protaetiae TaxID=2509455 RepID=A0A4P6FCW0_9MICO|nr:shikimate dehydrogenase [Agromyces protaetiae]QAY73912.1 shikimate dehydrogenase [Agromyces protaetiae]
MTFPDPRVPRNLAVLGSPIAHSKSPRLHAAAYAVLGLPWRYTAMEAVGADLPRLIDGLDASWRGLSLTMPLKVDVIPLVDELDRVAALTGAVNTVRFTDDGRRLGFNTDVDGLARALGEAGRGSVGRGALVGGGATAASALVALADLGARSVDVYVRTPARADSLVDLGRECGTVVEVHPLEGLVTARPVDVVVGALAGGAVIDVEASEEIRRESLLFEVAYDPWPSALVRSWREAGGEVVHGLGMLLHQALLQVRIFVLGDPFEELPDEASVLAAMRAAIA